MAEQDKTLYPLTGPDGRIQDSPTETIGKQEGAPKSKEVGRDDTEDKWEKSNEEQDSAASQGNNGGSSGDSDEKPPNPDNHNPTTNEQEEAPKSKEIGRDDTEDKRNKSHEEQDSAASQGNHGGSSGDSDEKVKWRAEKVVSPEREEGGTVDPLDLLRPFPMTHQKEGDEESGKNQKTSGLTAEKEIVPTPSNSDRTDCPQDPSETEERNGKIAQMDQEKSPSSPENKEEKELIDSPRKEDENKTAPENGAGIFDTGEGRKEATDFGREGEEGETAIESEKRDEKTGKGAGLMAGAVAVAAVILAILAYNILGSESLPEQKEVPRIDIFLRELETVKAQFPSQRPELWRRSRIHLERHLQAAHPTEPVSLILTAGRRAEGTLHCLAQRLASSFSTALNASVLYIEGASKAKQDSDQVKLDIDSLLREAFEGDKPVAVIHRFEELPPGSTLIFYRYCDHENAAYKKTSLIFTVLLGGEEELPAQLGLSTVEEMVDDHLQRKFLSTGHPTAFDRMDLDKYSGLWSRISHLILPVAAEERIEHQGCLETPRD